MLKRLADLSSPSVVCEKIANCEYQGEDHREPVKWKVAASASRAVANTQTTPLWSVACAPVFRFATAGTPDTDFSKCHYQCPMQSADFQHARSSVFSPDGERRENFGHISGLSAARRATGADCNAVLFSQDVRSKFLAIQTRPSAPDFIFAGPASWKPFKSAFATENTVRLTVVFIS